MNWLSLLIPVYNVEPYLAQCVESVMEQAGAGVQVMLLDDCSTDGSWALMQTLAARWPGRLQLLQHASNGGLSAARNTMLDAADGDYLWFLDSDDKLLPGSIAALQRIVGAHAPDLVLCDFSVWRERTRLKHVLRGERHRRSFAGPSGSLLHDPAQLLAGLLATGQLHAWSKISRRALWPGLRFPEGRYFEDLMTMPQLATRAASFYHCAQPWVAYRQRGDSILATMNATKARDQAGALLPLAACQPLAVLQDARVQFAWAHQCARGFIGAMRYAQRLGQSAPRAQVQALADGLRADFERASPLSPASLAQAYLRRGWLLRWLKLRRWLNWRSA